MTTHISRRNILRGMAVASAATGGAMGATAAPGYIKSPVAMTKEARLDAAIKELQKAALAISPDINDWLVQITDGGSMPLMIVGVARDA